MRVLAYLIEADGAAVGRPALLMLAWGIDEPVETRRVDSMISLLRKKVGKVLSIISVPGEGYKI
jgi:DNA-binding response OmpR family regulator